MSDVQLPVPGRPENVKTVVTIVAAVCLFVAVYIGAFVALGGAAVAAGTRAPIYWAGLASAAFATWLTVRIIEQGRWRVGFFVHPRLVALEGGLGILLAAAVIGSADLIIVLFTGLHHTPGNGFPWYELVVTFIPAATQEELLFRGYVFQRIRAWNRPTAIVGTSVAFSLLHAGNRGITAVAIVNLTFAGVLLALAYERYERLWFPIGIHLAWNVLSGPILGYQVSGYGAAMTVLRTAGGGPAWATGGVFGIEASAWMIPVELAAIAALLRRRPVPA